LEYEPGTELFTFAVITFGVLASGADLRCANDKDGARAGGGASPDWR
jgi:hypothetical protein